MGDDVTATFEALRLAEHFTTAHPHCECKVRRSMWSRADKGRMAVYARTFCVPACVLTDSVLCVFLRAMQPKFSFQASVLSAAALQEQLPKPEPAVPTAQQQAPVRVAERVQHGTGDRRQGGRSRSPGSAERHQGRRPAGATWKGQSSSPQRGRARRASPSAARDRTRRASVSPQRGRPCHASQSPRPSKARHTSTERGRPRHASASPEPRRHDLHGGALGIGYRHLSTPGQQGVPRGHNITLVPCRLCPPSRTFCAPFYGIHADPLTGLAHRLTSTRLPNVSSSMSRFEAEANLESLEALRKHHRSQHPGTAYEVSIQIHAHTYNEQLDAQQQCNTDC